MGFFSRKRHEPQHLLELLIMGARGMLDDLPNYVGAVQLEMMEHARVEISIALLELSFAAGIVEVKRDPKMSQAFSIACDNYITSMPGREAIIEWDYYVVDPGEMSEVRRICAERFAHISPYFAHISPYTRVSMDTVLRVLSVVRNEEYVDDMRRAMQLSERVGEGRKETLLRVFRELASISTEWSWHNTAR